MPDVRCQKCGIYIGTFLIYSAGLVSSVEHDYIDGLPYCKDCIDKEKLHTKYGEKSI